MVVINIGYRLPTKFLLDELNLLAYFPLFSVVFTICGIACVTHLNQGKIRYIRLIFSAFLGLSVPLFIWYITKTYPELLSYFIVVLTYYIDILLANKITIEGGITAIHKMDSSAPSSGGSEFNPTNSPKVAQVLGLYQRNWEITQNLEKNSLISKYEVKPSVLQAAKQKFALKNPKDVPEYVILYTSWYNLKCKALTELTVLKHESIQKDSSLTSRISELDRISDECTQGMNKVENDLPRSNRRFISNTFKNKPW